MLLVAQRGRAEQGASGEGKLPRARQAIQYDACATCRGHYLDDVPARPLQHPKGKMTSETPSSVAERRLAIARRLFEALVTQDPNRSITLRDAGGGFVARHDPRPEQGESEPFTQIG